jgi:hypothetical protein
MTNYKEQQKFNKAIENVDIQVVKSLLKNNTIQPELLNNWAIKSATKNGDYLMVKTLLEDPRVDPTESENYSIKFANNKHNSAILNLLWSDQRIKNTLQNDDFIMYNILIKKDIKKKVSEF